MKKSNPNQMKTNQTKKVNRICMCCDKDYQHNHSDKKSKHIEDYCKYLGCCNIKCYDTLSHTQKRNLKIDSFCYNLFNLIDKRDKY